MHVEFCKYELITVQYSDENGLKKIFILSVKSELVGMNCSRIKENALIVLNEEGFISFSLTIKINIYNWNNEKHPLH